MGMVQITYFSDILCIWAYASQVRVNAVKEKFADDVRIEQRFCSVFGDTGGKISSNWKDKGGYQGFNTHLRQVARQFPHIEVHPELWLKTRPASSASAHLFIKAIQCWEREIRETESRPAPTISDQVTWAFRCAFFRDCRDIARWDIQCEIAEGLGVDVDAIETRIHGGFAFAHLSRDYQDADKMRVEGSPSFVLNEGRQKLYGNVGFRLMEVNIQELLRTPRTDEASWC